MPRVTLHISGQNPQPYRFTLNQESLTIGRGPDNDMVVDSGSVSVVHAEIQRVPGGFQLRDLQSTNGITLDGFREEEIDLLPGANVKIGDVVVEYELLDDEFAVLMKEMKKVEPVVQVVAAQPIEAPYEPEEYAYEAAPSGGSGKFLLFLLFLVLAFGTGLSLRFHKETGGSLIQAVQSHFGAAPESK